MLSLGMTIKGFDVPDNLSTGVLAPNQGTVIGVGDKVTAVGEGAVVAWRTGKESTFQADDGPFVIISENAVICRVS